MWVETEIRKQLIQRAAKLNLRMPQVQTLLSKERFIARVARLEGGSRFIWKGGSLVLRFYQHLKIPRFTVDVDFLARGIDLGRTEELFKEAMALDLEDGFEFLNLKKTEMSRVTPYGGERYEIGWRFFGKAHSESLKVDVCTGDDVDPRSVDSHEVFILQEEESLSLSIYPAEFIFAEKLETADRFFTGNTRFKDFIDMWNLIRHPMNSIKLKQAIHRCFQRRNREFRPQRFHQLFGNTDFIALMERAKEKRYQNLALPPVAQMFRELGEFVRRVG